jgi:nucleotide-binding universal stress UspA family protein
LVPVLGTPLSRKAVHEACRLAVQFGVHPKVLLILSESVDMEDFRFPGDTRTLDQIIGGILSEYRNIAESLGVEIETEFRTGEPATVALEEITSNQYDFVVVGRRTPLHLGWSRLELEKVGFAARLLETSPIPVLVVSEAAQV